MTTRLGVLSACLLVGAVPSAWSNGGGSMSMPEVRAPREESPQDKAKSAYNDLLTLWKNADANIPIVEQARTEYARLP